MFRVRNLLMLAVAAMLWTAGSASATFQMKISWTSGGGGSILLTDQDFVGPPPDSNPALGVITYIGGAGLFDIQVDTGTSKPVLGSAAAPQMDINYIVTKTGGGAESLTIEISDDGFVTSPLAMKGQFGGTFGGTVTSVSAVSYFDNTNTLFGTAGGSSTGMSFAASPFAGVESMDITGVTPYSLMQRVVINADAGAATSSGDYHILPAVPAPAGLILGLIGVPVLGLGAWLRQRRAPVLSASAV